MTVGSTTARATYTGNGTTTQFSTGFAFAANAEVRIIKKIISTGVESTWVLNTDYTLTGAGTGSAGTITALGTPPSSDVFLTVLRNVPFTQTLDANSLTTMPATDIEAALDKIWQAIQQLDEVEDRSIKELESATTTRTVAQIIASAPNGWSPKFAIATDSARRVLQLVDWVGGTGTKPTDFINQYVTATGFSSTIANGVDIRGPQGAAGAGTGDMLAANNLSELTNFGTARMNLGIDKVTNLADADYTILNTDHYVNTNIILSAPRTLTLPLLSTVPVGKEIVVLEPGNITASNTWTVQRAGTDVLNPDNITSIVLNRPGMGARFIASSGYWVYAYTEGGDKIVNDARTISAGGIATGGGTLAADRTITVTGATQAEAEAGTDNTKAMTPLRTKQAIDATGSSGALVSVVTYTTTQTITIPTGATKAEVALWGGSGGGGGCAASSTTVNSGAGAGHLDKYLTGLTPGNTLALTIGAAGTGGATTPTAGGAGGNSVLASGTQTITTLTANGGSGGLAGNDSTGVSAAGGTATNGDSNITGQRGFVTRMATGTADLQVPGGMTGGGRSVGGRAINPSNPGEAGVAGGCVIAWFK